LKKGKHSFLFFSILFSFSFLSASTNKELIKKYYNEAVEKSMERDLTGTVEVLERALKIDGDNQEIKEFLSETLTSIGMSIVFKGDSIAAKPYFDRAAKLSPDKEQIKEMAEKVRILSAGPSDISRLDLAPELAEGKPVFSKEEGEILTSLLSTFLAFQRKQLITTDRFISSQEFWQDMVIQADKERKKVLKDFMTERHAFFRKLDDVRDDSRRDKTMIGLTAVTGIVAIVAVIGLILIFMYKILKPVIGPRNKILEYQERILARLEGSGPVLKEAPVKGLLPGELPSKESYKEIEIIEAEMSDRNEQDAEIATELLKPFLNDDDTQVKTKAIRAIHKYNSEIAIEVLEKMSEENNAEIRYTAAQILSEICSPAASEILLRLLGDSEINVKREVVRGLQKILEVSDKEEFPPAMVEKIKNSLDVLRLSEGWVVE